MSTDHQCQSTAYWCGSRGRLCARREDKVDEAGNKADKYGKKAERKAEDAESEGKGLVDKVTNKAEKAGDKVQNKAEKVRPHSEQTCLHGTLALRGRLCWQLCSTLLQTPRIVCPVLLGLLDGQCSADHCPGGQGHQEGRQGRRTRS